MMDANQALGEDAKTALVEQFRASLDLLGEDADGDNADGANADDLASPVDLHSLLTELAVLRSELRIQSRQFKAALDELQSQGQTLREHHQSLQAELQRSREQTAQAKAQAERGLLLGLLELRDRLHAGLDAAAQALPALTAPPSLLMRWLGQARARSQMTQLAQSLHQGSSLSLARLDELLLAHKVRPLPALGQAFDPELMRAHGALDDPAQPNGVVLRELRGGYLHAHTPGQTPGQMLLRAAEVIVNKKATP